MVIHELPFPVVFEQDKQVGYGGDQEWYTQSFQKQAGCASVAGANIAAYYAAQYPEYSALYSGSTSRFQKAEYLAGMEGMYRSMTPGLFGFPVASRFEKRFLAFAAARGVTLRSQTMYRGHTADERIRLVKEAIAAGDPIAFLILRHRAPELREDNWHWVTITGWIEDPQGGDKVLFSNCGARDVRSMDMVFEDHPKNVVRMVRFVR